MKVALELGLRAGRLGSNVRIVCHCLL